MQSRLEADGTAQKRPPRFINVANELVGKQTKVAQNSAVTPMKTALAGVHEPEESVVMGVGPTDRITPKLAKWTRNVDKTPHTSALPRCPIAGDRMPT